MVWDIFFGPFWGDHSLDHVDKKRVTMQRGGVPMQRGARLGIFDVPLGSPTWPSEGSRNIYKTNAFLHFENESKKKGAPEADAKDQNLENSLEK